jgi:hypothetical protein
MIDAAQPSTLAHALAALARLELGAAPSSRPAARLKLGAAPSLRPAARLKLGAALTLGPATRRRGTADTCSGSSA